MSKRYFSAESAHGSSTSHGFANDTIVLAFDSKSARDRYVAESPNLSCRAIRFDEVTAHAANWSMTNNKRSEPRPFTGEFWGIEKWSTHPRYDMRYADVDGLIGRVGVCYRDDELHGCDRLYR
jgi:hypothetical protein